ncbi:hypothetical protein HMPREF9005_2007 [Actinomyces sp. oral taxon 178 str. F0338]|nr:hypothetical protein HMPREF9005_2007 [Actinomyces sp. oral taxon 178 str. F0338]
MRGIAVVMVFSFSRRPGAVLGGGGRPVGRRDATIEQRIAAPGNRHWFSLAVPTLQKTAQ